MYEIIRWSGRSNTKPKTIYVGIDREQAEHIYTRTATRMRQGFVRFYEYGTFIKGERAYNNRTRW